MLLGGDPVSGYILAVAGAVLLSAVFSVLLPGGKTGPFLKGISRLFVFAVLVAPLVSLLTGQKPVFDLPDVKEDSGYLIQCARLLSEQDGEEIARYLGEEFSLPAVAETERSAEEGFPVIKIEVKVHADGITGEEAHIDMTGRVKAALARKYHCEEALVEVKWED